MIRARAFRRVLRVAPVLAGPVLAACSTGALPTPVDRQGPTAFGPGSGLEFLERVESAPFETAFRGVRRVEVLYAGPLVYTEDVGSDGQGKFAVEVLEIHSGNVDPLLWTALHDARSVFHYRYRDWRIHDYDLFVQNYVVQVLDPDSQVAGVSCMRLEVARNVAQPHARYVVDIDPVTALVLRTEEYDGAGVLQVRTEYESFALDPDLSGLPLGTRNFPATTQHDLDSPTLVEEIGFAPRIPTVGPYPNMVVKDGLIERMELPSGEVWVRIILTDGLEISVLMSQASAGGPGPHASLARYVELGTWTGLEGDVEGTPVIAAGRTDVSGLELMLLSAF